jgi:hypothetical protein
MAMLAQFNHGFDNKKMNNFSPISSNFQGSSDKFTPRGAKQGVFYKGLHDSAGGSP